MSKQNLNPPRWANQLLEWLCNPALLEAIEGDLHELFCKRVEQYGATRARWLYIKDIILFVKPFALKREKNTYSQATNSEKMQQYFRTIFRSLNHNKSYTLLNICGLTIGMTCCLILFLIAYHEINFDTFHKKADRIYRVHTLTENPDGIFYNVGTPFPLAKALRNDVAQLEKVANVLYLESGIISLDHSSQKRVRYLEKKRIGFASPEYFELFDYELISGNLQTALTQPNSVILTQNLANKYFHGNALNQVLNLDNKLNLKVTGIVKDLPANTSFPFQMLISYASLKEFLSPGGNMESWNNIWSANQTYVLLPKSVNPPSVEKLFHGLVAKYMNEKDAKGKKHVLQALKDIHFDTRYELTSTAPIISKENIRAMLLIGAFLLLTACINFINLATAQAFKRAKEVGIRKLLGSTRSNLLWHFIGETFIITSVAAGIAIILVKFLIPYINNLLDLSVAFQLTETTLLFIVLLVLSVTLSAGLYPAWLISGFKLLPSLKNYLNTISIGGISLRRSLVTLQFVISQLLIIGTIVIISQMEYIQNIPLGFNKDAIITVPLPNNQSGTLTSLRSRLLENSHIQQVSFAFNHPLSDYGFNVNFQYKSSGSEEKHPVDLKFVDRDYLKTYELKLLAGENFSPHDSVQSFIVNEAVVKKMGLSSPEEAIGKIINLTPGNETPQLITGVVQDFHSKSLHQSIAPCILMKNPSFLYTAGIKIHPQYIQETLAYIEKTWSGIYPENLFEYTFLDEAIVSYYKRELRIAQILKIFTGIAIFSGCLGIYGLLSFMAARRTKEISIRKIVGASALDILQLLSRELMAIILIANLLAWPIAWYMMNKWLENFAYRIDIGFTIFFIAAIGSLLISWFTISYQAIRAAIANPLKTLKQE